MALTASDINTLRMTKPGLIPPSVWNKVIDALLSFRMTPGPTYNVNSSVLGTWLDIKSSAVVANAWPFKAYDASTSSTKQVRINSGDGFAGTINGQPALVGGKPITTPTSTAPAPFLTTSATGFIFIKVWLNPDGVSINPMGGGGSGVDILWSGTAPLQIDPAVPPTHATQLIGQNTIKDGAQAVDNITNYGFTLFTMCAGIPRFE